VYVIGARFERFEHVSLLDAARETGVYVLWKPNQMKRPVRVGESGKEPGGLLSRLGLHVKKHGFGLDGVLAVVNGKEDARLVEGALLWCADEIGIRPPENVNMNEKTLREACLEWNKVRVRIAGQDPLRPPSSQPMTGEKVIEFELDDDALVFTCPWNTRR
jgi:hypothetical protein